MNGLFSGVFGDGKLLRRSLLVAAGLVALTFVAAQSLVTLVTAFVPDQSQRFSANSAPPAVARNYTVTRSVLDDQITTGSVNTLKPTRVDPCRN
jgi:hypothetical protein